MIGFYHRVMIARLHHSSDGWGLCAVSGRGTWLGRDLRNSSANYLSPARGSWSESGVYSHESHQRKSRMVEISLSGSGEGLGAGNLPGLLYNAFLPPRTAGADRGAGCSLPEAGWRAGGRAHRRGATRAGSSVYYSSLLASASMRA